MVEVGVAAGIGGPPAPGGDLGVLGEQVARLAAAADRMVQLGAIAQRQPIPRMVSNVGAVVAGAPLVIDLGTPSAGRFWNVRVLAVSDALNVTAAVAGTVVADWYVGRLGGGGLPNPSQWRQHQAVPAIGLTTSDTIHAVAQDHLICVVTGATTAGQLLYARAEVWDEETVSYGVTQVL